MDTNDQIEKWFEQYSDMAYRIAISYGNNIQMTEDIVQEVFLRNACKASRKIQDRPVSSLL